MGKPKQRFRASVGDLLEVEEHRVGEKARTGEILAVLGEPGREHYRVRWEHGQESIFYPGNDVTVRPRRRRAAGANA